MGHHMRRGTTLLELALVLAVMGALASFVLLPAARALDRIQVRAAAAALTSACAYARQAAVTRSVRAVVSLDTARGRVVVVAGSDTLRTDDLAARFGISLTTSNATLTYAPTGLATGLSNLRAILRRGGAADTVTVSRLGRVR